MEKDHLSKKNIVKNYEINQRSKPWARIPIAASSCNVAAHMYRRAL